MRLATWTRFFRMIVSVKKKGMPVLVCPCCNADFYFTGDSEKQ